MCTCVYLCLYKYMCLRVGWLCGRFNNSKGWPTTLLTVYISVSWRKRFNYVSLRTHILVLFTLHPPTTLTRFQSDRASYTHRVKASMMSDGSIIICCSCRSCKCLYSYVLWYIMYIFRKTVTTFLPWRINDF